MHPILIASKDRVDNASTIISLLDEGLEPIVFVEPHEHGEYMKAYHKAKFVVLQESNKGVSYVRRRIQEHARENRYHWYWMLDDDIKQVYMVEGGKCLKSTWESVLTEAEHLITKQSMVAIGSLEYQQYAWSAKKNHTFNSYCDVAVLVSVENTKQINYRDDCKEDRDFVLQCLSMGYLSMRATHCAFSAPKNGSNKGGLHEAYKGGLEKHWSTRMVQLWPGICEHQVKGDGRPDVKVNWRHFKARR